MWTCRVCHEEIEDSFEVCWSCGASIDGEPDQDFTAVKDFVPKDEPNPSVIDKSPNFEELSGAVFKGGCGCTIAFAVVGSLVLLAGGRVYIDPGGFVILFAIGGILGLVILGVYNKGKNAG